MAFNLLGFASAFATFLGVWLGHVAVRKIEREMANLWIPALIAFTMGFGFEVASFFVSSLYLSAMCGILGVTLLWDSFEFYRSKNVSSTDMPPQIQRIRATQKSWLNILSLLYLTGLIVIRVEWLTRLLN